MTKVSVIVPNYNHAGYLQQRIESILNQTYQDFELILLDDCSVDNSREVLLQYENHPKVSHLIFNGQNSGSTFRQWNKGIELAKGEYIWIAESDDWADKRFLETIIPEFENQPNVGLIYTASKLADGDGNITFENKEAGEDHVVYKGLDFIAEKLSRHNSIWNASMMVFRRSVYPVAEKRNLYSNMRYCGDWFFYVLLSEQTDVLEIRKALNYFRVHKQNVSTGAEKSGLTFTEGLNVYVYIKKKINFVSRFSLAMDWTKEYNKYKYRYGYSKETRKRIMSLFVKQHRLLYVLNLPIGLKYYLKNKI